MYPERKIRTYCIFFFIVSVILEYVRGGFLDQMKKFPCYHKKYQIKKFYCVNDFFLSFREHPFQNCRKRVREMEACRKRVNDECLGLASKDTLMYSIYVRIALKPSNFKQLNKVYCRNAGLVTKYLDQKAMQRVGCNPDYYLRKQECIEQFQKKWRHNRSSNLLEGQYIEMEKCINNNMKLHCSKKAIKRLNKFGKDVLSELSVDWNPFRIYPRTDF